MGVVLSSGLLTILQEFVLAFCLVCDVPANGCEALVLRKSSGLGLHSSKWFRGQSWCLAQHGDIQPGLHLTRNNLGLAPKSLARSNANATLHDAMSPCRAHLIASSCCLTGFERQCVILTSNKEENNRLVSRCLLPRNPAATMLHKAPPPSNICVLISASKFHVYPSTLMCQCAYSPRFCILRPCQPRAGGLTGQKRPSRRQAGNAATCSGEGGEKNLARRNRAGSKNGVRTLDGCLHRSLFSH